MRDAAFLFASLIAVCHGRRISLSSGRVQDSADWRRSLAKFLTAEKMAAAFKPLGLGAGYSSDIRIRPARAARTARSSMLVPDSATEDPRESGEYLSSEERDNLEDLQLLIDRLQALSSQKPLTSAEEDIIQKAQQKVFQFKQKELAGAKVALDTYLQSDSQDPHSTALLSTSEDEQAEDLEGMVEAFRARQDEVGLTPDELALYQKVLENLLDMRRSQVGQARKAQLEELSTKVAEMKTQMDEATERASKAKEELSSTSSKFGKLEEADDSFLPSKSYVSTQAQAWGVDKTGLDVVLGCVLFFTLHLGCCFVASAAGYGLSITGDEATGTAAAIVRIVSTSIFVLVDSRLSVVPLRDWLLNDSSKQIGEQGDESDKPAMPPLPLAAPLAAACIFIPYILLVYGIGEASGIDILPKARPWPNPGRAFDTLVAAPLSEEIFFRAWLLTNMKKAGAPDALGFAVQAVLWTLWHVNQGSFFNYFLVSLGFSLVYQKSGGSVPLTVGTHSIYNLYVLLFRAARLA